MVDNKMPGVLVLAHGRRHASRLTIGQSQRLWLQIKYTPEKAGDAYQCI